MRKFVVFLLTIALFGAAEASWYWPFASESDAVDEKPKRVSELVEPASDLIEEASDLAADGKTDEAVEKYREALAKLNQITAMNPDRAEKPEFATIRNKRAYVNAAIDSLLLSQVKSNAKVVAVSDTTELEKRLDRERWGKRIDKASEAFDHRASDKAFAALEKARAGTTNLVLLAVTDIVTAGVCCQTGKFESACLSLDLARRELERTGVRKNLNVLTREERILVSEIVQTVRSRIVGGYRDTFAFGRQVCEDNARLRAMKTREELTSTNAIALASNVVVRLTGIRDRSGMFAFPVARNVSRVADGMAGVAADHCGLMVSVMENEENERPTDVADSNLTWKVGTSRLRAALTDYGRISSKIDEVDAGLTNVLKLVEKKERKTKEETTEKESRPTEEARETPAGRPESTRPSKPSKPLSKREQAMDAIERGDFATARRLIEKMLVEKPNGAVALNLKAAMEARQGKFKEAEATLDQAIMSNPRNHFAYYNMANLMLQVRPDDKSAAKRYYETGRTFGGPVDARLEEVLK